MQCRRPVLWRYRRHGILSTGSIDNARRVAHHLAHRIAESSRVSKPAIYQWYATGAPAVSSVEQWQEVSSHRAGIRSVRLFLRSSGADGAVLLFWRLFRRCVGLYTCSLATFSDHDAQYASCYRVAAATPSSGRQLGELNKHLVVRVPSRTFTGRSATWVDQVIVRRPRGCGLVRRLLSS